MFCRFKSKITVQSIEVHHNTKFIPYKWKSINSVFDHKANPITGSATELFFFFNFPNYCLRNHKIPLLALPLSSGSTKIHSLVSLQIALSIGVLSNL